MYRTADRPARGLLGGLVSLGLVVPFHLLLPWSVSSREVLYLVVVGSAVLIGFLGLHRHRPDDRRGWFLLLLGASGWVAGDLAWTVEQYLLPGRHPAPSDAVYLCAYLTLGAGALVFIEARPGGRDVAAILDAAIIATGAAVLVGVFLIAPLAVDPTLSPAVKLVSAAYPVADLFLLGVVAWMYSAPGARTLSYRLLAVALTLALIADTGYQVAVLTSPDSVAPGWNDAVWMFAYLLLAAAACVPSMKALDDPGPDRIGPIPTRGRLFALAGGLTLPGVVLLVDGATGGGTAWPVIGIGTVVLSGLVLFRMDGLLHVVQGQAVRLSVLARSDFLTGAANRRSWDHELPRFCALSRERDLPLCVAILDLDHFKVFNDTHGHQAGDRLLQEAVAAWTEVLPAEALLARYGGEEFAVLISGATAADLVRLLHRLRVVTPSGQTFSAGVAVWDPNREPQSAVAGADEALYAAKRAGRDRILVHGQVHPIIATRSLPSLTVVTQPIIELATSTVSSHEALSRFTGPDSDGGVEEIFRRAHAAGEGDILELAAIRAALDLPGRPPGHELFVNVSARALVSPRFLSGLPTTLTGVVVELNENPDGIAPEAVAGAVAALRARGARIALDDLGAGGQEFARLAMLRPDVLKVDRSLVAGCATDFTRTAVLRALVTYARQLGLTVCAEGVEQVDDLRHLAELGVTHAQGHLLAIPGHTWRPVIPLLIGPRRPARPSTPESVG